MHHTPEDDGPDVTLINITIALRDKLNAMADRLYIYGNRCARSAAGRETKPQQRALLEAAWEVAQRYPEELTMAIMRRTEPRTDSSASTHVASGHRPR